MKLGITKGIIFKLFNTMCVCVCVCVCFKTAYLYFSETIQSNAVTTVTTGNVTFNYFSDL